MKGLFIKDLILLKGQAKSLVMIAACGIMMSFTFEKTVAAGYLGILGTMLAIGTIGYDEFDNGFSFLFTLPIERKTYVREKYLFALSCSAVSILFGSLIALILIWTAGGNETLQDILLAAVSMAAVSLLFISVMIPVRIKYNAEKSRTVMYIFYAAVLVLAFGGAKLIELIGFDYKALIGKLDSMNPYVILSMLTLAVIAGAFLSERISESVIMKKEY